ncbi:FBXO38 [Mytilus coruscus]|uniref:FBXO38 n=1 Tax=Mytilus coruscus TaxID=42192 RepID=A0A6J8ECP7_MYTCO|nr:FBXO38 [Mytilus coruscus]
MSDSEINADTEPILSNQENENIQIYERRSIYKIVAGKAITEPETRQEIKEYIAQSKSRTKSKTNNKSTKHNINQNAKKTTTKRKQNGSSSSSSSTTTNKKLKQNQQDSQQPGPSGLQKIVVSDGSITDEDDQDDDNTLCCFETCGSQRSYRIASPLYSHNGPNVNFYNVIIGLILNFACVSVLRRSDKFYCPCQMQTEKKLKNNDNDIHLIIV